MLVLYIILGLFYLSNFIIFTAIHYKKTSNLKEPDPQNYNTGMVSLLNKSATEPLLDDFV